MRLHERLPRSAGLALLLTLAACDGGGGGPPPDDGSGDACYAQAEDVSGSIVAFGAPLTSSGCYAAAAMTETPGLGQAAVRGDAFAEAPTCGACLAVAGAGGSRVVRMIEECVGCSAIDVLDVDGETWTALGGGGVVSGRLDVTVRATPCPVDGGLRFVSSTGTNPWFVQLYVTNHRHPLETVELRVEGAWVAMTRTSYGAFEWATAGETVESPYALRVTDAFGHVVEPTVAVAPGSSTTVAAQLPACG